MFVLYCCAACVAGLFAAGIAVRRRPDRFAFPLASLAGGLALSLAWSALRLSLDPGMTAAPRPWLGLLAWCGASVHLLFVRLAEPSGGARLRARLPYLLLVPALASDLLVHGPWGLPGPGFLRDAALPALHAATGLGVLALCAAAPLRFFRRGRGGGRAPGLDGLSRTALAVACLGAVALGTGLAGMVLGEARLYAAMDAALSLGVLAGALASFRWPGLLAELRERTLERRRGPTTLGGIDAAAILEGLDRAMRERAPYKDPDFSLEDLAAVAGLSRHQTSELLNEGRGRNFAGYVNDWRVAEARRLLRERPGMSVLAVAMEAGFGNKTSFNEEFLRRVGMTPTAWRAAAGAAAKAE